MSNVKSHEFKAILDAAIESDGKIALPNCVKVEDPAEALKYINNGRYYEQKAYRLRTLEFDPPRDRQTHEIVWYPKIFTDHVGMGSRFAGSGTILAGGNAYRFHMCEHSWDESGANHMRGWHPSICRKCGVDASIDSGD